MQNLTDKEIMINSVSDEKNACRVYGSFIAEANNMNLRKDLTKILEESADLAGMLREEMKKRCWEEESFSSTEKKSAVLRGFLPQDFSD